jgi:hypothetical protein
MSYEKIVTKNIRPHLESLHDDIIARRNKDFFWPTGTQVYCGKQGSGKTISCVKHLLDLKKRYPKAIIVSNIQLKKYTPLRFQANKKRLEDLLSHSEFAPTKHYILFGDMEELAIALTTVNNGFYGVIFIVDEIHTYFNALDSKNIPMYVFTEISQQRKQRKLIIGTSQIFLRMAKPLREQCDNLIICNTIAGVITFQKVFDGMSLSQDYDGGLVGKQKRFGLFWHNREIRNAFDTYQKVVSGSEQYEELQQPLDKKILKKMLKK